MADGSAIPSSLGVNPQMTIMAFALRTAEALDARLDEMSASRPADEPSIASPRQPELGFRGDDERHRSLGHRTRRAPGEARPFSFSLHARSRGVWDFVRTREVDITGELTAEGFGARCPLIGTLGLDVLATGRLPYDFTFTADDGRTYRFTGEKRVKLRSLRRIDDGPARTRARRRGQRRRRRPR